MKPQVEALILALDAYYEVLDVDKEAADRLFAIYQSRLDDVLTLHPHLSRETLDNGVQKAHRRWLDAQKRKRTDLPPTA